MRSTEFEHLVIVYMHVWLAGQDRAHDRRLVSILLELISGQAPNEKNNKVVGCSDVKRVFYV